MRFRTGLGILIIGGVGGFLANALVVPFLVRTNFLNTAVILDKIIKPQQVVTRVEERTIVAPQADYFSEAIKKIKPSVVAIQSFKAGQMVRSGSGIFLTQDGLIITVTPVVPTDADVFQVVSGDRIFRAKVVLRDYARNLAMLTVAERGFSVARLKPDFPELGRSLVILAKLVSFGSDESFVTQVLVSQANQDKNVFRISGAYDLNLYGSALIDNEANVLGMIDFRNLKLTVITAKEIGEALERYLAKPTKT